MASASVSNYSWLPEHINESDVPISEEDVQKIFEEIRQNYHKEELDALQQEQMVKCDKDETSILNEAISELKRDVSSVERCANCFEVKRIVNSNEFAKGQHLSMPGEKFSTYFQPIDVLIHAYKHHAIVKEVLQSNGRKLAEIALIHFYKEDGKIKIYETYKTIDLRKEEIYQVRHMNPRYLPDEIVRRAESMLPENRQSKSQFESYNLVGNNCEHFATWCVTGKKISFQVQRYMQKIAIGLRQIFGSSSTFITKGLSRIVLNSADEIASAFTSAINVPGIVLGGLAGVYLIYCIVRSVLHVKEYRERNMCHSCLKVKLQDLWLKFSVFGASSVTTFVILHFATPILATPGVPVAIVIVLLSIGLQLTVPDIRQALQSPFAVDKNKISSLSWVNVGDIISFQYCRLEHEAVVTEVNDYDHRVTCVHYALPFPFTKRIIKEETFTLNPSKQTIKLFDCSLLPCNPRHEVVELVRKRVNETKWSPSNRSVHLCYWAKVRATPRGLLENWENEEPSDSSISSTSFIRNEDVHLITDIHLGDVVKYERKGIVVGLKSRDCNYGRLFEIEMVLRRGTHIRKRKYDIDLNKNTLKVKIYHPAHCHPMSTRLDKALALIDERGTFGSNKSFIMHCIIRK